MPTPSLHGRYAWPNLPSRYIDLINVIAEAIEPPPSGQLFVRDSWLPGFALRVTAGGVKNCVVEARVKGQHSMKRWTLGFEQFLLKLRFHHQSL